MSGSPPPGFSSAGWPSPVGAPQSLCSNLGWCDLGLDMLHSAAAENQLRPSWTSALSSSSRSVWQAALSTLFLVASLTRAAAAADLPPVRLVPKPSDSAAERR